MKFYLKNPSLSSGSHCFIEDEIGNVAFSAQRKISSFKRELFVFNSDGTEVAYLYRNMFAFSAAYYINIEGVTYKFAKKSKLWPIKIIDQIQEYILDGTTWSMYGKYAGEHTIFDNEKMILHIKPDSTFCEVDIPESQNTLICLCLALALDSMYIDRNINHQH